MCNIAVLFFMAYSSVANATSDGSHIICEDRVWEYVYSEWGSLHNSDFTAEKNHMLFRMKFDGEEEHDGRIYHRLVYTGDLGIWGYNTVDGKEVYTGYRETPNNNTQVYLMREDAGKIYLLNEGLDMEVENESREFLVYDFTLGTGDSASIASWLSYWNETPVLNVFGDDAESGRFSVISTETVTVDGIESLVQNGNYNYLDGVKVIEGIGFVNNGFLPMLQLDMRTASSYIDYTLNRVYSSEGDILYRGLDLDYETLSVDGIERETVGMTYAGGAVCVTGEGQLHLALYDMTGRTVATAIGEGAVSLSTDSLAPGVYTAVCRSSSGTATTVLQTTAN